MYEQFQESLQKLLDKLIGWLDSFILALPNILLATLFVFISVFIARRLKVIAEKYLNKAFPNKTIAGLLSNLTVAFFLLFVLFVVLNILDLSDALMALLGTAGVAGLAVGFALQDPMTNLFSGMLMSVRDYYQIGDLVEIEDTFGHIHKINLRSTIILTLDGQEVIIPNKDVLQNPLKNYSHNPKRRIDIACGVAYGDDLEKVKKIAVEAIENCEFDKNETKPVQVFFTDFGDSSINFTLRFWKNISKQEDYMHAKDQAIIALKKAFDQHEITIPFPIRTLDFGVVGGLGIHEIYPPSKIQISQNNNEPNTH